MRILVTGAGGQLGSEIKKTSALFRGHSYLFTDLAELNVADGQAVEMFFKNHTPDVLINCAAYTAVDAAETDRDNALLLNSRVPSLLGAVAKKTGCRIIHISTDYVFEGTGCRPYREDDEANPGTVYGLTKLEGERGLLKEDSSAMIVRTSWLYSLYGNNFVKTMMKLGRERDVLKVVYDQAGSPTFAGDLAAALLQIISGVQEKKHLWSGGVYHYANEGIASWYDFAVAIHELAGIQCNIQPVMSEEFPTPAIRPSYSVLDKSKIKSHFGISIPYWRDSLKKCIDELPSVDD